MIDPNTIDGEIVRETQHAYVVKKSDDPDKEVIICKYCGKEFSNYGALSSHLRKEHPDVIQSKSKEDDSISAILKSLMSEDEQGEYIESDTKLTKENDEHNYKGNKSNEPVEIIYNNKSHDNYKIKERESSFKTPEEIMKEQILATIRTSLKLSGIKDKDIDDFIELIRNEDMFIENPMLIIAAVKERFSKISQLSLLLMYHRLLQITEQYSGLSESDILSLMAINPMSKSSSSSLLPMLSMFGTNNETNSIKLTDVIAQMKHKRESSQLTRENIDRRERCNAMSNQQLMQPIMPPAMMQPRQQQDPMQTMMMQMFMNMMQMMMQKLFEEREKPQVQQPQQYIPPEIIEKVARAEAEKKMLETQLQLLREQMKEHSEMMKLLLLSKDDSNGSKQPTVVSGEWRDDYAKLIAQLGSQTLQLASELIKENKKTRQMIIKYVLPQILANRRGMGEPVEQVELEPKGKTDEDIIAELRKEGLIEEETSDNVDDVDEDQI